MIYLDNAATSFPKAPGVAAEVARAIAEVPGSAGRASHAGARAASAVLFDARADMAAFMGIPPGCEKRLVFTKSATEALNLAIMGLIRAGGCVAVSDLEHNAVMRPLRFLEEREKVRVVTFHCGSAGNPDMAALERALDCSPDLVIMTAASNVTGALPPAGEAAALLASMPRHPPLLVDASQYIGHFDFPAGLIESCIVAFSAHKGLLAPAGVGCLWLPEGIDPEPLIRGGTGSASESETQPEFLPDRYEAGTHNIAALAGLRAALHFINAEGMAAICRKEGRLTQRLLTGLLALPRVSVSGPPEGSPRAPLVSFVVRNVDPAEFALELDRRGIASRVGLHCAPAAHKSAGTFAGGGSIRLSPGYFTSEQEIDMTLAIIKELIDEY